MLLLTAHSKVLLLVILLKLAQPTQGSLAQDQLSRTIPQIPKAGYPITQKNKSTFKSMTNNSTFESAVNNYTAEVHCQYDMMM